MTEPAANEPQAEQQLQVQVPPMTTAIDQQAYQVLMAGLGELPGKVSASYMVRLEQQWAAHCNRHVEAARQKAADELQAAKDRLDAQIKEDAAARPNRAARRAKKR